jgi:hypothetical protein
MSFQLVCFAFIYFWTEHFAIITSNKGSFYTVLLWSLALWIYQVVTTPRSLICEGSTKSSVGSSASILIVKKLETYPSRFASAITVSGFYIIALIPFIHPMRFCSEYIATRNSLAHTFLHVEQLTYFLITRSHHFNSV